MLKVSATDEINKLLYSSHDINNVYTLTAD